MSIFKMPKGVVNRFELLFRNFPWGDKEDRERLHLVGWSKVIKPKSEGGLDGVGGLGERRTPCGGTY